MMKLINCLKISMNEMKNNKSLFLFYLIVFVSLISVGTSMLDVSFYLPERISASIREMNFDWMTLNIRHSKQLDSVLDKYDMECIDVSVDEFYDGTIGLSALNDELYTGGVILDTVQIKNTLKNRIKEKTLKGNITNTFTQNGCGIYIDQRIAQEQQCDIGQKLQLIGENGEIIDTLEIKGIYKNSDELNDYYIEEMAYNMYKSIYSGCALNITLRTTNFKDIFSFVSWVTENHIEFDYNKDMIGAMKMFYIVFTVFDFILLLALAGILFLLLDMYIIRRTVFYGIGSAIGMTPEDVIHILIIISEVLIGMATLLSLAVSNIILNSINKMADNLFSLQSRRYMPMIALLFNWIVLQPCIFIIISRFHKKLERNKMILILHHK